MKNFTGKNVLITGGAAGIGKMMARIFLQKGANVIIWDIHPEKMNETIQELSVLGKVVGYRTDVSKREEIQATAQKVREEQGFVDVLINNAGIVVGKYFHEHSDEEIQKTMDINALAPVYITKEFLPAMLERNTGHVCTIASSAGLISNPKMSMYVASKWSALGWSDSLRLEMQKLKKNIGVTTVTPYYINTGMFDGIKSLVPILKPEKVAKRIVRAIEKNRIILSMPWSMHFVRFSQGILPIWLFDWFVGKVLGVYTTMDNFKGHQK